MATVTYQFNLKSDGSNYAMRYIQGQQPVMSTSRNAARLLEAVHAQITDDLHTRGYRATLNSGEIVRRWNVVADYDKKTLEVLPSELSDEFKARISVENANSRAKGLAIVALLGETMVTEGFLKGQALVEAVDTSSL